MSMRRRSALSLLLLSVLTPATAQAFNLLQFLGLSKKKTVAAKPAPPSGTTSTSRSNGAVGYHVEQGGIGGYQSPTGGYKTR